MIGNDRKYPDAVYSAVGKHDLGDTLTRRQIDAVLDTVHGRNVPVVR